MNNPVYYTIQNNAMFSNLSNSKNYNHLILYNPITELQLGTTIHKHVVVLHVSDFFGHLQGGARGGGTKYIYTEWATKV